MLLIAIIIALVILIIASITDMYNREVPDYVSYGLMFIAGAIAVLYTIIYQEYTYIAQAGMGFILGMIVAYGMFYLGQWGGGDSKLMMGLGAIMGFNIFPLFNITTFGKENLWLLILLVNIIFFGAIYGLGWSVFLAIKKRKIFIEKSRLWLQKRSVLIARKILLITTISLLILVFTIVPEEFRLLVLLFTGLFYLVFYIWLFVKIIEETCMVKDVPINKLTEGDWIYKDVFIGKKYVTGPKELGISKEQIELLKKYSKKGKIKTVTIKEGIPFIPAFLLAFIATVLMYYFWIF